MVEWGDAGINLPGAGPSLALALYTQQHQATVCPEGVVMTCKGGLGSKGTYSFHL